MSHPDIKQGSTEWRLARCGKLGASRVADAIAKTRTGGWGASRANLLAELIAERLTGVPNGGYQSAAMMHGTETEPDARAAYAFRMDATVTEVGFIDHPTLQMTGASPDGFVGEDGLVECKCPNTSTHIDTLLGQSVPGKYVHQMQWQMACTGRKWCDFVSFDPRLPEAMRLFIRRVKRDDDAIDNLFGEIMTFLRELDMKERQLRDLYELASAA